VVRGRGILVRGEEISSHHNAERSVCCVAAGADLLLRGCRGGCYGLVGRGLAAGAPCIILVEDLHLPSPRPANSTYDSVAY
jgi:hypothetical protein